LYAGVVPESAGEVEEKGAHEEGARETRAQRAPAELQRPAHPRARAPEEGGRETGEENSASAAKTTGI